MNTTLDIAVFNKKFNNISRDENPTARMCDLLESDKDSWGTVSKQTRLDGMRVIYIQLPQGKVAVYKDPETQKFFYDCSHEAAMTVFNNEPVTMFMTQDDWVKIPCKQFLE